MAYYMLTAFQALLLEVHTLSVEQIAARLYFLCGCCRYLSEFAYLDMISLSYLVDPARYKAIFFKWTHLMLQEMDTTSNLTRNMQEVVSILFRCMDIVNILPPHYTIFDMWLHYTHNKDSWYSFRNRALLTSNGLKYLGPSYSQSLRHSSYGPIKIPPINWGSMNSERKSLFRPMIETRSILHIGNKRNTGGFKCGEMPYGNDPINMGFVAHSFNQNERNFEFAISPSCPRGRYQPRTNYTVPTEHKFCSQYDCLNYSIVRDTPAWGYSQMHRVSTPSTFRDDAYVKHTESKKRVNTNPPGGAPLDEVCDGQDLHSKYTFTDIHSRVSAAKLLTLVLMQELQKAGRTVTEIPGGIYVAAPSSHENVVSSDETQNTN